MAQDVRLSENTQPVAYHNNPADRLGYETFRRVVLHLSAIQDHDELYAEPLVLKQTWTIPAKSVTGAGFRALEKEFLVTYSAQDNTYTLLKYVTEPIIITNYDVKSLSSEERERLIREAASWSMNDVAFDIRPTHFGGNWPIDGNLSPEEFPSILNFLGRSAGSEPEYDVAKDPRTPPIKNNENPTVTMGLIVADSAPVKSSLSVRWQNLYYSVDTNGPLARWNRDAFQMVYLLFQMTITDIPGLRLINIAKVVGAAAAPNTSGWDLRGLPKFRIDNLNWS